MFTSIRDLQGELYLSAHPDVSFLEGLALELRKVIYFANGQFGSYSKSENQINHVREAIAKTYPLKIPVGLIVASRYSLTRMLINLLRLYIVNFNPPTGLKSKGACFGAF